MDLHDRFDNWLADGADGDPPRDLALHASTCDGCMQAVAVVESLQAIQVGAAEVPPLRFGAGRPRPFRVARMAIGALAVILLGVSIAIGASGMLAPAPSADVPTASTAERVLAGVPTDEATDGATDEATDEASPTPTPAASDSPSPSPSTTPTASPQPTVAPAQPAPPPRTAAPQPPPPPPPTAAPPTPAPTAVPTVAPTAPPPTPSPTPSEIIPLPLCSNGLDDDGDTLIDFVGGDPGCTDPLDDDETDPAP